MQSNVFYFHIISFIDIEYGVPIIYIDLYLLIHVHVLRKSRIWMNEETERKKY